MKVAAGETLDEALATLAGNFSSSNQYFDLLVQVDNPPSYASSTTRRCSQLFQVFSGQVGGGKQPHLANFYLILPPLGSGLENQCFQFTMCKKNILTILAAINYIEHLTGAKEKIFKKVRSRHNPTRPPVFSPASFFFVKLRQF